MVMSKKHNVADEDSNTDQQTNLKTGINQVTTELPDGTGLVNASSATVGSE
jgi:hypothetical protein